MSRAGARRRIAATAVAAVALLAANLWGSDDLFPFAPFQMYAFATPPSGRVVTPVLEAVDGDGRTFALTAPDLGLRRAELGGQLHRLAAEPGGLGLLAEAWSRANPDAEPLRSLRVVRRVQRLDGGEPAGPPVLEVLAEWSAR